MIQTKKSNILMATENIIVQSVNHQGKMGSGLAKQLSFQWPLISSSISMYQQMCKEMEFSEIKNHGLVAWCSIGKDKMMASVFGQDYYGTKRQYTDYVALGNGLDSVRLLARDKNWSVAIPFGIGCGLGGGDWIVVERIIQDCFKYSPNIEVSIYYFR